ncbi:UDP-glucose 4-epimerase [Candidatus Planktophila sulfonica]|uniref:UDP-glucose 4-epimerase n=1 Tax=Candidatus Planktophila sulfonica TaxID=1884904 RepID=A0A249KF04_9ACTN|nr:NAD-dependent epimerase/dehydratase family protein [Candidatus Planktophila sulfonica]ASY15383.1 UDP-glucose 4-epimerase [Candidatus Planktophila sulfonica]
MRAFITGGAGFIGSHLADALIARGDSVTILDNLSTGSKKNIAHLEGKIIVHEGDIRDKELVDKLVAESDLVFHMAAALGVKNIMEHTIESIDRNFSGSEVVLNAATKHNKRLLIASTSEIYGKNPNQPLHEESDRVVGAPQKIRWTYSDAKALEEAVAHTLHKTHGLRVTTVRFFNTVGPRQTGQYGMVVPRFIQAALKNEDIVIYDDGSQSRVFCHVEDAVRAVLTLVDTEATIGDYFNVGGTGETTIKQLAEKIINLTESKSEIKYVPYADAYPEGFEDMQRRVPDISKIRNAIGWAPVHNLESIIKCSISRDF